MATFGIIVVMIIVLLIGGFIALTAAIAGLWFEDIKLRLLSAIVIVGTGALEIFIFTTYFTMGLK